jgi:cytochrome c2
MQPAAGFVDRKQKNGKKVGQKCARCHGGIAGRVPPFVQPKLPVVQVRKVKSKFNLEDWNGERRPSN